MLELFFFPYNIQNQLFLNIVPSPINLSSFFFIIPLFLPPHETNTFSASTRESLPANINQLKQPINMLNGGSIEKNTFLFRFVLHFDFGYFSKFYERNEKKSCQPVDENIKLSRRNEPQFSNIRNSFFNFIN